MKRLICILLTMLLVLSVSVTAFAAEFEIDQNTKIDGMSRTWYQGYAPSISYHKMTLCLPIRAESCVGDITVSIALDDPNVFVLSAQPKEVVVSPKDSVYPVKLVLPLEQYRRNGDYPATITIKGSDGNMDRPILFKHLENGDFVLAAINLADSDCDWYLINLPDFGLSPRDNYGFEFIDAVFGKE